MLPYRGHAAWTTVQGSHNSHANAGRIPPAVMTVGHAVTDVAPIENYDLRQNMCDRSNCALER